MEHSIQPSSHPTSELVHPYQLKVTKELSYQMAEVQAKELLTQDILNKIGNLSLLELEIIKQSPQTKELTTYLLRKFVYESARYLE